MSTIKTAFRGGLWLGFFNLLSQLISWTATIVVARLLSPGDYGLMAMATVLTGYVQVFYEMGIGAAVIQREHVTDEELSSLFWALVFWGAVLALFCLLLAYPTVLVFQEPRLFHVTQAAAALLVLGTAFVVPGAILRRQLRFKAFGFVSAIATVCSCITMVPMALFGAGVWTLIGGVYARSIVSIVLAFVVSGWRPQFHFHHQETVPYLRFGLPVVGGASLKYLYHQAPIFFGGRAYTPAVMGHYSLAFQLASIPNDKILALINSVSYPLFSRMQNDAEQFRHFYLRLSQFVAFIVLPVYCGGMFLAGDLIPWALGEKWESSVLPFQLLCAAFLCSAMCSPNHLANTAQGRPQWTLYFHLFCGITMTTGFWIATLFATPSYLAIPWAAVFAPVHVVFSLITLRALSIPLREIAAYLQFPVLATLSMLLVLCAFRYGVADTLAASRTGEALYILLAIVIGATWYACYTLLLQRSFVQDMIQLAMSR